MDFLLYETLFTDISNSDLRGSSTPVQKSKLSHSLKNFGSQIKLDPSISYIGAKKLGMSNKYQYRIL